MNKKVFVLPSPHPHPQLMYYEIIRLLTSQISSCRGDLAHHGCHHTSDRSENPFLFVRAPGGRTYIYTTYIHTHRNQKTGPCCCCCWSSFVFQPIKWSPFTITAMVNGLGFSRTLAFIRIRQKDIYNGFYVLFFRFIRFDIKSSLFQLTVATNGLHLNAEEDVDGVLQKKGLKDIKVCL